MRYPVSFAECELSSKAVFKKFEKENLFQIMCAGEYKVDPMDRPHELTYNLLTIQDIVERFSLTLMLSLIAGRNLIEIVGSDIGFDPRSLLRGNGVLKTIMSVSGKSTSNFLSSTLTYCSFRQPVLAVILSEMVVDWLKHGFITKFNHIKTTIYGRYTDVLCKDILLAAPTSRNDRGLGSSKVSLKSTGSLKAKVVLTLRVAFRSGVRC